MMTEKRFTVHIKWFNYEKTEGEIELFDNGQPLLLSESVEDVQWIKSLLNELQEENKRLKSINQDYCNYIGDFEDDFIRLAEENKKLQERNDRQYKQLGDLYRLIEEKDWRALTDILDDFKRNDEQLQKEWSEYND